MENVQQKILNLIKEATGHSDVMGLDFKDINQTPKSRIDFKKVRGSVRLIHGKVKTPADVQAMKRAFIALRIP